MKWTKENDDKLRELILIGKKHKEISEIMSTTIKSITNRCGRLGLVLIHKQMFFCEHCNKEFKDYISNNRKFCSNSCSNSHTNLNRKLSKETKKKISEKLIGRTLSDEHISKISGMNHPNYIDGRSNLNRSEIINGYRKCKLCGSFNVNNKHKRICEICRYDYYKVYRPSCEFDFNINEFKDRFDFSLVEEFGWYSPTNKRNNLNGVSKDHLYSVKDGFINKIDFNIIKHPANCRIIRHDENNSKNSDSIITLEELKERIKKW